MDELWAERDKELNVREQLATVIATYISGVKDPTPNELDYFFADEVALMINNRFAKRSH
jgi:hypothetical protein